MDPFVSHLRTICGQFPTRAKWIFVPGHAVGRTLADQLALTGTDWANLRFVTPLDLATRMAAPFLVEQGIDPSEEGLGPALMMRLLLELPDEPGYFKPLAKHPALARALWNLVSELRLAAVRPDDIAATAFESAPKHRELQALYRAYEHFLTTSQRGDRATVFAEALRHPDWCPMRVEDGWTELPDVAWPPLARRLMDAMPGERLAPHALAIPGAELPRRLAHAVVTRTAPDATAPLAFLLAPDSFVAARGGGAPEPPDGARLPITLFHAGGREAEIDEVFRRIVSSRSGAVSDEPIRTCLDQVEIACASDEHTLLVWEKACLHEWPITLAEGVPAALTRPGRALVGFISWIESDFAASTLRQLLQSGDLRVTTADGGPDVGAGQAAQFLLKAETGWGRAAYTRTLTALAERYRAIADSREAPDEARALTQKAAQVDAFRDWVEVLLASIPTPDRGGGAEEDDRRGGMVNENSIPPEDARRTIPLIDLVDATQSFLAVSASVRSAFDAAAVTALITSLDDLRQLGQFHTPLDQALRFVRERAEGVRVGADRPRPGHLFVSSLRAAHGSRRPHLYVVGLEEGRVFPKAIEDAVLLDREREQISPALQRSTDRVDEAVYALVSRLALAASAPGHTVTLSYSSRDLREYRHTYASWLLLQVFRLVSGDPSVPYAAMHKALGDAVSRVPATPELAIDAVGWWLNAVKRAGAEAKADLFRAFPPLAMGRFAVDERASESFTEFDGYVPAAGDMLDPTKGERVVSVTQLERMAACPFRYFVEKGLGVKALEEEGRDQDGWLDPATRGTILHALYAALMRRVRDAKRSVIDAKDLPWLLEQGDRALAEHRAVLPPPSDEVFEREREDLMADLRLFVEHEVQSANTHQAVGLEVSFGMPSASDRKGVMVSADSIPPDQEPLSSPDPVILDLGDGLRFRLVGRIDRIDQLAQARYEVIDYKTGYYADDKYKGEFAGGTRLQHALYGLAVVELLKRKGQRASVEGGTYYHPTVRGRGERKFIPKPEPARVRAVMGSIRDVIAGGLYLHARDGDACRFCDYGHACGVDAAKKAETKLNDRVLLKLVELGKHE